MRLMCCGQDVASINKTFEHVLGGETAMTFSEFDWVMVNFQFLFHHLILVLFALYVVINKWGLHFQNCLYNQHMNHFKDGIVLHSVHFLILQISVSRHHIKLITELSFLIILQPSFCAQPRYD